MVAVIFVFRARREVTAVPSRWWPWHGLTSFAA